MTKFTKEQLIERARTRLEHMQEAMRDHSGSPDACMDLRLAEMAYAAVTAGMEQEPVAWRWFHLNQWHVVTDEERARDLAWDGVNVMPLYAAPQLPQPAVPVELLAAMEEVLRISDREHDAWNRAKKGIADCRSAMLQGAEPVQAPTLREWTNEQCLEFLSVAFRHNEISGDIEFDDIRLGVRFALAAAPQQEAK